MSGKAIIIIVAGIIMISGIILYRIEASSTNIVKNVNAYYYRQTAQNLAQSGANMALRAIANNNAWRTGFPLMNLQGEKVLVTAADSTWHGRSVVKIISVGIVNYNTSSELRETSVVYIPHPFTSPPFKGLVTANTAVSVNGNMTIDGRDHTTTGVLIPTNGTLAIYTTSTFSPGGSSQTGGTGGGSDYAPVGSPNPAVVAQNQPASSVPQSPDSAMGGAGNGFSEGTLKQIAQSGLGGSQYSSTGSGLKTPLQGVTYVENNFSGSMDGSGILIIHNSSKSALYKNTSGNFTGILIVDDLVHVHSNVTGVVVVLTPNPSAGNVLGNGNGSILFSRTAIANAVSALNNASGNGSASNVIGWWE
jgi:hypothetical protein